MWPPCSFQYFLHQKTTKFCKQTSIFWLNWPIDFGKEVVHNCWWLFIETGILTFTLTTIMTPSLGPVWRDGYHKSEWLFVLNAACSIFDPLHHQFHRNLIAKNDHGSGNFKETFKLFLDVRMNRDLNCPKNSDANCECSTHRAKQALSMGFP